MGFEGRRRSHRHRNRPPAGLWLLLPAGRESGILENKLDVRNGGRIFRHKNLGLKKGGIYPKINLDIEIYLCTYLVVSFKLTGCDFCCLPAGNASDHLGLGVKKWTNFFRHRNAVMEIFCVHIWWLRSNRWRNRSIIGEISCQVCHNKVRMLPFPFPLPA